MRSAVRYRTARSCETSPRCRARPRAWTWVAASPPWARTPRVRGGPAARRVSSGHLARDAGREVRRRQHVVDRLEREREVRTAREHHEQEVEPRRDGLKHRQRNELEQLPRLLTEPFPLGLDRGDRALP